MNADYILQLSIQPFNYPTHKLSTDTSESAMKLSPFTHKELKYNRIEVKRKVRMEEQTGYGRKR